MTRTLVLIERLVKRLALLAGVTAEEYDAELVKARAFTEQERSACLLKLLDVRKAWLILIRDQVVCVALSETDAVTELARMRAKFPGDWEEIAHMLWRREGTPSCHVVRIQARETEVR